MTRFVPLFLSLILAASLGLAAGFGGYLKTAHDLARAGQQTITICGGSGAQSLVLDAQGNPVSPQQSQECAHCADCSLVPLAALFAPFSVVADAARGEPGFMALTSLPIRALRVWHPSRGPPFQSKV